MKFYKNGDYIEARVTDDILYKNFPDGRGFIRVTGHHTDFETPVSTIIYQPDEIDFRGIIHYKKKFRNTIDKYMEGET